MKILRLILWSVSVLVLSSRASADDNLTGQWAGLAPDGVVFAPTSGLCSADVALDLTQAGASLGGVFSVIAQNRTGGCVVQNSLSGVEQVTGQVVPSRVTGTVGSGTVSFNVVIASFRNGVPVFFSAIVASGTFSATRLTATGTLIPRRAWADVNGNHVPDCNLLNPAPNGECGAWTSLTTQSMTLTAERFCTISATSGTTTSWNKFNVPAGTTPVVWVHAQFKPTEVPTATTSRVRFTGVSFVLNGHSYPMPDGLVTFDPAASLVSGTIYDASNHRWVTTINPDFISDENFFVGAAIPVDATITGGGQATIRFTTQTNTGLSFSWKWSAAAYTYWPSDWNAALIQPYHGNGPTGSQHADTPNNTQIQQSLIQGPRGGGGSNFTGGWSGTYHGAACQ